MHILFKKLLQISNSTSLHSYNVVYFDQHLGAALSFLQEKIKRKINVACAEKLNLGIIHNIRTPLPITGMHRDSRVSNQVATPAIPSTVLKPIIQVNCSKHFINETQVME